MMTRIKKWIYTVIHINRYKQEYETRFRLLEEKIDDIKKFQFERDYNDLLSDQNRMKQLKLKMSVTPIVWGDPSKLTISEKAAVSACIFNTNSGNIVIGDYTYAGSGVSILAGSHDSELNGFLRRDVEYKEGFDIKIGKGVWLASNSMILGPCTIEDDAVIAAGAVVAPGTHVHKGELYAGIPAKKIRDLKIVYDLENNPYKLSSIIDREDGVLFYSGWSEKKVISIDEKEHLGHWKDGIKSTIYTNKEVLSLLFHIADEGTNDLRIMIDDKPAEGLISAEEKSVVSLPTGYKDNPVKVVIESEGQVFISREESDL